jgi:hypothetical protein
MAHPRYRPPSDGIRDPLLVSSSQEGKAMPLTDARCRSAQPGPRLQKLTDGGGLQLWLQPTGARLWRLAYRFDGKQKLLALGVYPAVPLARAAGARGRQTTTGRRPRSGAREKAPGPGGRTDLSRRRRRICREASAGEAVSGNEGKGRVAPRLCQRGLCR